MNTTGLREVDIIEVDKKGRIFWAMVTGTEGREIQFRPLDRRITYRCCTAREIIGRWGANTATRARHSRVDSSVGSV
jgi:hypothetical protein